MQGRIRVGVHRTVVGHRAKRRKGAEVEGPVLSANMMEKEKERGNESVGTKRRDPTTTDIHTRYRGTRTPAKPDVAFAMSRPTASVAGMNHDLQSYLI